MAFQYTDVGGNPVGISAERLNGRPENPEMLEGRGVSPLPMDRMSFPGEDDALMTWYAIEDRVYSEERFVDDPDPLYAACEEQDADSRRAPGSVDEATGGILVDAITGEITAPGEKPETPSAFVIAKATERWMEDRGRRFAAGIKNWRSETVRSTPHSRKSEERAIARQARIDARRQKKEEKRLARGGTDGQRYRPVAAKKRQKGHTLRRHREVLRNETSLFLVPESA